MTPMAQMSGVFNRLARLDLAMSHASRRGNAFAPPACFGHPQRLSVLRRRVEVGAIIVAC